MHRLYNKLINKIIGDMEFNVIEKNDVQVVSLVGSLDTNTAVEAESKFGELLDAGAQTIIINFENLDYISSAGLRIMLVVAKKMNAIGGKVILCSMNPTVKEVFEISGFSTIFQILPTEDDALAEA